MTMVESLPHYAEAEAVAKARGSNIIDMISAYLAGVAAVGERRVVKVNTVYKPKRSSSGRIVLPAEWDDPKDAIYDNM